ncbi:helix-turn-helix transcriptional regulator [Panacibacter sp. DH6]|uniref:Helix-turn-helix transcriptional regulator n=1 Tax=Panacibacter microcysteis TaxID=2793269 RepID=A0A931E4H1_9BACT|nr:AraC family transcriptional regulator [Panacibacter microcysteis]MBG9377490.1 helix-turn-helix transcriptional regulator [Panacibacter microcysteis]
MLPASTYYHQKVLELTKNVLPAKHVVDKIIQAKHIIETHYTNNIDLDFICSQCCLSKFHMLRLYKTCYGQTPFRFLHDKRIAAAKKMLKAGASVNDTCYHLSFESRTSFSAYFKKHTGTTPSQFRKKQ